MGGEQEEWDQQYVNMVLAYEILKLKINKCENENKT